MSEHPSAAELDRLVRGELTREQARSVVRHLLHGCESCVAQIAPFAAALLDVTGASSPAAAAVDPRDVVQLSRYIGAAAFPRRARPAEPEPTPLEKAYDRAIDRAFSAVLRHGENAARLSAGVRQRLATLTAEELLAMAELPDELRGFAAYEALLERSWALRREDARQMVRLAELACLAAAELGEEGFSAGQVEDFEARAAVELANAYRVVDRMQRARAALDRARAHFRQGSQDRLLGARLLEVTASIHGDLAEYDVAFAALDGALKIYRRYGDAHLTARTLIKKGIYYNAAGFTEEAIAVLGEGLELTDPQQDPEMAWAAIHNTALCLVKSGRLREARSLLFRHLGLAEQQAGRQGRLLLRWLQAEIYVGLGDLASAEHALQEVRQSAHDSGRPHDEVSVLAALAHLCLRRGEDDRARAFVLEAAGLVQGLEASDEVKDATRLLGEQLQRRAVPIADAIEAVNKLVPDVSYLRRGFLAARSA